MSQEIVEINITTNGYTESGEVATIIVDADKVNMVDRQSLFRTAPNGSHFIVMDPRGKLLKRHGETKSEQAGVSLTSYLFGKIHMRRNNVNDVEDYSTEAYNQSTGKPAAIDVMNSEHSHRPIRIMYADEYMAWKREQETKQIATQQEVTMSDNPNRAEIDELNSELHNIKANISAVREVPAGQTASCPCCGSEFTKAKSISVYCSSLHQDGKPGCKEKLNSQQTHIRKQIKELGGEVTVPVMATGPRQAASEETSNLPAVIEPFKTIGGIPFTLTETKDLMFTEKDRPNFKTYRGITFSLSEMRKLILE